MSFGEIESRRKVAHLQVEVQLRQVELLLGGLYLRHRVHHLLHPVRAVCCVFAVAVATATATGLVV